MKSAYAIYAAQCSKRRPNPIIDYLTTVLPLLLGVTLFATQPSTFNAVLLCIFGILFNPTERALQEKRHAAGLGRPSGSGGESGKSKGKWLDESDSDEEPAQPASTSIPVRRPVVSLPSEVISASSTLTSPDLSVDGSLEGSSTSRRRRRSASPADNAHTAIDVLPTPEMLANGTMLKQQQTYPSAMGSLQKKQGEGSVLNRKLPFLSVYRAHMMIMTIHCILAVDFPIFPRWLGKCEDFGTSLVSCRRTYLSDRADTIQMDVGVGSFVFSLGIVSTQIYTKERKSSMSLVHSAKKALPVLALGMIRVIMVKGVEYPVSWKSTRRCP